MAVFYFRHNKFIAQLGNKMQSLWYMHDIQMSSVLYSVNNFFK